MMPKIAVLLATTRAMGSRVQPSALRAVVKALQDSAFHQLPVDSLSLIASPAKKAFFRMSR